MWFFVVYFVISAMYFVAIIGTYWLLKKRIDKRMRVLGFSDRKGGTFSAVLQMLLVSFVPILRAVMVMSIIYVAMCSSYELRALARRF